MRERDETHLLLGRLNNVRELQTLLAQPLPEGLSPQQVHILSGELPADFDAAKWGRIHPRSGSSLRWTLAGMLLFAPIGLAGILLGSHWIWLPGMLASGAVWGWFAHFYWRIFRSGHQAELQDFGLPQRDLFLAQSEMADGAVILVLCLRPVQVDSAERWLAAQNVPAYHILV